MKSWEFVVGVILLGLAFGSGFSWVAFEISWWKPTDPNNFLSFLRGLMIFAGHIITVLSGCLLIEASPSGNSKESKHG